MGLLQDFKFGIRLLVNNPGFTIVAVLTLALGMGVNSTVFTLVNGVLLKGMPFENPDEIVVINSVFPNSGPRSALSYLNFRDVQDQSRAFTAVGGFSNVAIDLSDQEFAAERVPGSSLTSNTFSLLGQRPLIGRDLTAEDARPGAEPVALISYGVWQTRYGGDASIIGRTIRANLIQRTVVGVMPQNEGFPNGAGVWLPFIPNDAHEKRDQHNIEVFGRLASGSSLVQAQTELTTIGRRLADAFPATNKEVTFRVNPYTYRETGGPLRTLFFAMQGAVGFVLLIACANVANLLLSRALRRTRETSIRTALGASRWRIIRQLIMESLILSFLGGVLGLALAALGVRMFWDAVKDTGPPYWLNFAMDYRVFLFFFLVSIGTGTLFGLAPALQISKANINEHIRDGGRGMSGGVRSRRLTSMLLVGEIALTIVLLVGAGLMVRSFLNMQNISIGVQAEGFVTAAVTLRSAKYPQPEDRFAFQERLMERLRSLPGVDSATIASHSPAAGAMGGPFRLADRDLSDSNGSPPGVSRLAIAPGYFQALGLTMMQGREFNATDGAPGSEGIIVNQTFAAKYWPNENPAGKRIRLGDDANAPWINVIGVSPPVFQTGGPSPSINDISVQPTVYIPYRQESTATFSVLTRSRIAQETLTSALRNELRNLDPDIPLFNIRSLDETLRQRAWPNRVFGSLFAIFAVIALVMASVGIYGVTAYGVGQRTQEIGIRMALGATGRDVLWMVLRQGLIRISVGMVLGILAAWGVSRVLSSLLFGVNATDPLTFAGVSILMTAVMVVACVVPARRAMRLHPVDALRTE